MLRPFSNEPLTDFSQIENVVAFRRALARVTQWSEEVFPVVIGGEWIHQGETFASINPARPAEQVGAFVKGTQAMAEQAVEAASEAFQSWRFVDPFERARYLLGAAAEMRRRKHEFSAIMVLEVGKSWVEADADTAEAIDFLEYYARQMMRLAEAPPKLLAPYPPEELDLQYIPLGVGVVIPPWNFPNAIMTGMTAASIVSGNPVILKPASASPLVAYKFCEIMWDLGLPPGVLNFLPGPGGAIGDTLVDHPKTRFIAFTGSKAVGLRIHERAAKAQPGQVWIKRTILEMGGKDAVVVDAGADLDAAAQGIVASAFGFQGQKCSAGSRAIIVADVYDAVVEKIVNLAGQLTVGATDAGPEVNMGPVVDAWAMKNIMAYIETGRGEGKLALGGDTLDSEGGYFINPTIFVDVDRSARIAQEEIFGPVLAVIKAKDFDDALAIANGTEYGLTGAVYSRSRAHLERARREFHVGNLYFNRKCTGALVGVHPFGGFNMSGTDSKAGGPDYLLLFTQAKSIADRL
ncbi:MAG: L-glutamate gamma-semialdehyde dehydrogenase [Anaerolineae bacterium]|nr:L-glutamate gamma-semialdehyde dehydrogenase [Anaerolineae bacterium]